MPPARRRRSPGSGFRSTRVPVRCGPARRPARRRWPPGLPRTGRRADFLASLFAQVRISGRARQFVDLGADFRVRAGHQLLELRVEIVTGGLAEQGERIGCLPRMAAGGRLFEQRQRIAVFDRDARAFQIELARGEPLADGGDVFLARVLRKQDPRQGHARWRRWPRCAPCAGHRRRRVSMTMTSSRAADAAREAVDENVDEGLDAVAQLERQGHVEQFDAGAVQGVAGGGFGEARDGGGWRRRA